MDASKVSILPAADASPERMRLIGFLLVYGGTYAAAGALTPGRADPLRMQLYCLLQLPRIIGPDY